MNTENPLAAAHANLVTSVEALIATNGWEAHLKTQAAFHNYSFQNILWLACQAAERGINPVRFAGFNTWKKLGRSVQKGQKSFKVLAPVIVKRSVKEEGSAPGVNEATATVLRGFRVVSTFELSQTSGAPLPELCHKLQGTSEEILASYQKIASFAVGRGWSVSKEDTGLANGSCSPSDKAIRISPTLSDLQALKTLCHEVAHSILHADDLGSHGAAEREVEAESVAYVVLNALGFDSASYSFGYVASWSGGSVEMVKKTGERVQRAAKTILDAIGKNGETFSAE